MKFELMDSFESNAISDFGMLHKILGGAGHDTDNNAASKKAGKNGDDCTSHTNGTDDPTDDGHCEDATSVIGGN